jgi:hypothetical protein
MILSRKNIPRIATAMLRKDKTGGPGCDQLLWIFVYLCSLRVHMLKSSPLRLWCPWRYLSHEEGTLINGISALKKETQRAFSPSIYHVGIHWEANRQKARVSPHHNLTMLALLSQTSSLQKHEKQIFIVYKLLFLWYFEWDTGLEMYIWHMCAGSIIWDMKLVTKVNWN